MPSLSSPNQARSVLTEFVSKAYLTQETQKRVEHSLGLRVNPQIMRQALKSTEQKVRTIMEHLPQFNSSAFGLSVPGPDLFEIILLGEYAWHHALAGERTAQRFLGRSEEPPAESLARCLNSLGFYRPEDLEPFRKYMECAMAGGGKLYRHLIQALDLLEEESGVGS